MPPKKNHGPCSIPDCQTNSNQYRRITDCALTKIREKDIDNQYNYLEIEMQLCYPHYLSVVEPDRHNKNKSSVNSTRIIESSNLKDTDTLPTNSIPDIIIPRPLSFGNKIALMTKILYEKQRKEQQS